MGDSEVPFYVYRIPGRLGTNVTPDMWHGPVDELLEGCPMGWQISFDVKDGQPVDIRRSALAAR